MVDSKENNIFDVGVKGLTEVGSTNMLWKFTKWAEIFIL